MYVSVEFASGGSMRLAAAAVVVSDAAAAVAIAGLSSSLSF